MTSISKRSLYNERLYHFSLSNDSIDEKEMERRTLREMSQRRLDENAFITGLKNIGKTASGSNFAYLTLDLHDTGIATISVHY